MRFPKYPTFSLGTLAALACAIAFGVASPAPAQGMFDPVVRVNDRAITAYEVDQRANLLKVLRAPGDPKTVAVERLIEERLQLDAAAAAGITPSEEDINAGLEEFASRANLSAEEFTKAIAPAGVSPETLRDFIRAGVAWRQLVQQKFGPRARATEAEVDRALAQSTRGGLRVLLTELILPANTAQATANSERLASEISQYTTAGAFSSAVQSYSVSPSRAVGGKLDWLPLENLPPQIRGLVLTLAPGQVTAPIPVPNAIALFQLRAIEETGAPAADVAAIDYAAYYIAGGQTPTALADAARVRAKVDRCDDLYGIAKGQPESVLDRGTLPVAEIPQDIAMELAKLDAGEVSTALTRSNGQTLVFLMMCGRTTTLADEVSRQDILLQLSNERLGSYANGYLAELRADAVIVRP
ncbi:peptidylprolyl isomerase [Pseudogemmobacter sp. W21_MBD1_M6]|uniref:peptidylprolyl isomerase n=1 Tax=Pseudogemmobacter sp. W21_MBD1_M6 TaxID=3240271 RepID=UPI003F9D110F